MRFLFGGVEGVGGMEDGMGLGCWGLGLVRGKGQLRKGCGGQSATVFAGDAFFGVFVVVVFSRTPCSRDGKEKVDEVWGF